MQNAEYRKALVDWVNERTSWTHFITLTTKFPMTVQAMRLEVERFIRRLTASTQGPVYNLWVLEKSSFGHPHVHMVAQLGAAMTAGHIASKWAAGGTRFTKRQLGRTDIQPYDDALRGVAYITKTLPSEDAEWGLCLPRQFDDLSVASLSA